MPGMIVREDGGAQSRAYAPGTAGSGRGRPVWLAGDARRVDAPLVSVPSKIQVEERTGAGPIMRC